MKTYKIISILFLLTSLASCIKIEFPVSNKNFNDNSHSIRELNGIEYSIIKPEDYAKQIKEGKIGIGQKFVIDGLCLGTSDNLVMIQKSGFTNLFKLDNPMNLNFGQKVRIYVEVTLVNNILVNLSEAKIIKIEKL
jgi:hypothetical protein